MRAQLLLAPFLLACNPNPYNQGEIIIDTGEEADADADADTDADADADADVDTGTEPHVPSCPNPWDPVDGVGWTKDFDIEYRGSTGTGRITGLGSTIMNGVDGFRYQDTVTTSSDSFDVVTFVSCEGDAGEGMYLHGWDGTVTFSGFITGTASVLDTPPRRYLPEEEEMGNVGSWTYSYTMNVSFEGEAYSLPVTGTYMELPSSSLTLPDGTTVNAYRLSNTYAIDASALGTTIEGYIEQSWVKGMGLVAEINLDTSNGSTMMSRELTSWSGLTPTD